MTKIEEKNAAKFSDIIDTSFLDLGLNTTDNSYAYKVDFIVNGSDTLGTTSVASSIFLNLIPSDKTIELNWNYNVPWVNDSFRIYRRTENDLNFNLIKVVSTSSYRDENLNRDSIYCYKIEGIGAYTNLSLKRPLLNFSQENCAQPKDTVAPCPPILTVRNFCNDDNIPRDDFTNYLRTYILPKLSDGTFTINFVENDNLVLKFSNSAVEFTLLNDIANPLERPIIQELLNVIEKTYKVFENKGINKPFITIKDEDEKILELTLFGKHKKEVSDYE